LDDTLKAIEDKFRDEPYAKLFGIDLVELGYGRAVVKMEVSEDMMNLFGWPGGQYSPDGRRLELATNSMERWPSL
jgi:acyl-coenzyme A thioesterase PaaI-like protein